MSCSGQALITLDAIRTAADRIEPFVKCTPIVTMTPSLLSGGNVDLNVLAGILQEDPASSP